MPEHIKAQKNKKLFFYDKLCSFQTLFESEIKKYTYIKIIVTRLHATGRTLFRANININNKKKKIRIKIVVLIWFYYVGTQISSLSLHNVQIHRFCL